MSLPFVFTWARCDFLSRWVCFEDRKNSRQHDLLIFSLYVEIDTCHVTRDRLWLSTELRAELYWFFALCVDVRGPCHPISFTNNFDGGRIHVHASTMDRVCKIGLIDISRALERGTKTRHTAKTRHTPFFHQDGVDSPMLACLAYQQTKSRETS